MVWRSGGNQHEADLRARLVMKNNGKIARRSDSKDISDQLLTDRGIVWRREADHSPESSNGEVVAVIGDEAALRDKTVDCV